ncbi:MAG: hypothetical protein Q8L90_03010, partial [Bacteroidota bacterium]|nr:hypothetical protein [Bacteroidota bacterium]
FVTGFCIYFKCHIINFGSVRDKAFFIGHAPSLRFGSGFPLQVLAFQAVGFPLQSLMQTTTTKNN